MRKRSFQAVKAKFKIRKRSLLLGDSIYKLTLIWKAMKAEFTDEKEKFSSW